MKPEKTAGIVRAFDLSMAAPEILDDYGYLIGGFRPSR